MCDKSVNLNQSDNNGNTALMLAAYYGHTKVVELLLSDKRVNVNQSDNNGTTALMLAAYY